MKKLGSTVIPFQRRDAGVRAHAVGGGGGMSSGGGGGDLEKRVSRLETSVEALIDIRSDIRLILGGGISGGVLLLSAIIGSHLNLQEDIGASHRQLREELTASHRQLREELGEEIRSLRAKDDMIIERLGRLETSVAVLLVRTEGRAPKEPGSPNPVPGATKSSAERETLH